MNATIIRLLVIPLLAVVLLAGRATEQIPPAPSTDSEISPAAEEDQLNNGFESENGFSAEGNRLPLLLRDVKLLMTDAIIADTHGDTLEVVYLLDRIFDLLEEAEQFGEMTEEDHEEFTRFENTLLNVYANQLSTIVKSEVSIVADQITSDLADYIEPLEVEAGDIKFTVVDDREGHIPILYNKKVEQAINFFQTKGRDQFAVWLSRYALYHDMVVEILAEYSLPEELIYLSLIESGMNPKAYSRANAVGMWQFIYSTGKNYGLQRTWWVDERRDPVKATRAAAVHLQDLYSLFDDWYLALAAYNAGPARIQRAVRLHQTNDYWQLYSLPRETRNYIPTYLAAAIICREPEKYGFNIPERITFAYDEVKLEHSAELAVLANCAGITVAELRQLNPELRQSATPTDSDYTLKIPVGIQDKFMSTLLALPEEERFAPEYVEHRVRYGETLWDISKRYKVSIHELASVNKIHNRHKIKVGQKLTIPVPGQRPTPTFAESGPTGHEKVVYVVRKGDTLGQIAEDYKTSASRIRNWNNLRYGQFIYPGQKLTIWIPKS
ncbi:MAG: LysM peptidoglycan-binding domain-containing protein [Candidatus Neomarinimicrobiota bacterium]